VGSIPTSGTFMHRGYFDASFETCMAFVERSRGEHCAG
jgi:hypothetical protein